MRILVSIILIALISPFLHAEEFSKMCPKNQSNEKENLSVFHCGSSGLPKYINKLFEVSEVVGDINCKMYLAKTRRHKDLDLDKELLIFDKNKKTSRPLRCYCQDKSGLGLCQNEDYYDEALKTLEEPFLTRAWAVFSKDLIEISNANGGTCIPQIKEEIEKRGCSEALDEIHQKTSKHMSLSGKDGEILKSKNLDILFKSIENEVQVKEGMERLTLSSFLKSNSTSTFITKHKIKDEASFWGKTSSEYEAKLKEIGIGHYLDEFAEVLRSDDPEKALREVTSLGVDFFSLNEDLESEDVDRYVALGSHPDLKFLFSGIESFSEADRRNHIDKFRNLSKLAKENPFLSFKELRDKYKKEFQSSCAPLIEAVDEMCKKDYSSNLAITKELIREEKIDDVMNFGGGDLDKEYLDKVRNAVDDMSCFEFPKGYVAKDSRFTELVGRSIDPMSMADIARRSVGVTEAKVELAITKVQGMESVAKRIEKLKAEGTNPAEGIALDFKFKEYLSKLELPNGQMFSYSGNDAFEGVAAYKNEVYRWADKEVENRLSEIQGETEAIVKSDLSPKAKKEKLEQLMTEVQRLNNGGFLKEVFEQKQAIADQIARYEDEKANWEAQYGEEARREPKAVQEVAPPRSKTKVSGNSGTNSYKSVGSPGTVSNAAGTAAGPEDSVAYIPARPSVPYAQGSMLTRIVPKDEFSDNTVKASLLARHKGYPIAVLDEKSLTVELYTPNDTSYKLQETLTITEAEARGYVFPDDVKKLVESYRKDKKKGRAPASFVEYEPKAQEQKERKEKLAKLQSLADTMERQGVPRRSRVVRLNQILDSI